MHTDLSTHVGATRRLRPETQRLLAWAGIVGPVVFTLGFLAQEAFRRSEYSPMTEPVSALEAGPHGWVQQLNFLIFAALTFAQAIGLHGGIRATRRGWAGPALLALTAVGLVVAAVFPLREDAAGVTYDPGGHMVGGLLFFFGSPAALIVLSRRMRRDPRWSGLASYALATGIALVLVAVVTATLVIPDDGPLHDWAGLVQRVAIVALLFPCRIALGVRLLRVSSQA